MNSNSEKFTKQILKKFSRLSRVEPKNLPGCQGQG